MSGQDGQGGRRRGGEETALVVDFRRARSSLGPRRRALIQILTKVV